MSKLPDLEAHMQEVHKLATDARHEVHANPVETSNNKVVAPIFMGGEKDIIPERYVIHYTFTQCQNCGNAVRDSEFYGLVYLRSRMGGTRVRHLVKCTRAAFNVPVDRVLTGTHKIPFCEWCHDQGKIDLSHLPLPPEPTLVTNFPEMRLKGQKPKDPSKEKPKAEPKKPATLDDLI